jgi:hypothetical protein
MKTEASKAMTFCTVTTSIFTGASVALAGYGFTIASGVFAAFAVQFSFMSIGPVIMVLQECGVIKPNKENP